MWNILLPKLSEIYTHMHVHAQTRMKEKNWISTWHLYKGKKLCKNRSKTPGKNTLLLFCKTDTLLDKFPMSYNYTYRVRCLWTLGRSYLQWMVINTEIYNFLKCIEKETTIHSVVNETFLLHYLLQGSGFTVEEGKKYFKSRDHEWQENSVFLISSEVIHIDFQQLWQHAQLHKTNAISNHSKLHHEQRR